MTSARGSLDADALAALEDERDFLLRSIDDLDREFEAGDLDEDDYGTLRDEYTARAAATLHALDEHRATTAAARPPRRPLRLAGTLVGVLIVAGLAGWGVARAAGDRSSGEQATGGVAQSLGQQLSSCLILSQGTDDPVAVLECYDDILAEHPANAEALTYRGWFLVRAGLPQLAWPNLADAVAVDPEYADVRVFRAIALERMCRPEEALAELDTFDSLDPLPEMRQLVDGADLRGSITALQEARDAVPDVAGAPPPIEEAASDAERIQCDALAAAGVLDSVTTSDGEDDSGG